MKKKRRTISYEEASRVAHLLADELGPAEWLRGIGVVADKEIDDSYAVAVLVAKELRDAPPPKVTNLPEAIEGVPIHREWRGLARARRGGASAASRAGTVDR